MLRFTIFLLKLKGCPLTILQRVFKIVKPVAYGSVAAIALQVVSQEILRHAHYIKSRLSCAK